MPVHNQVSASARLFRETSVHLALNIPPHGKKTSYLYITTLQRGWRLSHQSVVCGLMIS